MRTHQPIAIPSISIFVRHHAGCKYADDEDWKKCDCTKYLRWSHGGRQHKQTTKSRTWAGAEEAKRRVEEQFFAGQGATAEVPRDELKTIKQAAQSFVAMKQSQGVSPVVIKKYERELARLVDFFGHRNKMFPRDMDLDTLIAFRAGWEKFYPSPTTRQKVQERLRGFLRYCYEAGHAERIPRLSPIQGKPSPTKPLSATEYDNLLKAVPETFKDDEVKAKRVRALMELMRHSGLAIRDAVTLERDEIQHDEKKKLYRIVTARQKTGSHVSVPIPEGIAKEVLAVLNGNPRYVFWSTGKGKEETAVSHWQHDLRKVFRKAGFPKGHPHQLRDTFAVNMLTDGVPLGEVSKLLGHESIKTTERYYAKWVPERQDRLDSLVVATWKKKKE